MIEKHTLSEEILDDYEKNVKKLFETEKDRYDKNAIAAGYWKVFDACFEEIIKLPTSLDNKLKLFDVTSSMYKDYFDYHKTNRLIVSKTDDQGLRNEYRSPYYQCMDLNRSIDGYRNRIIIPLDSGLIIDILHSNFENENTNG